jgi:ferredoxin--NADP+ reductase
MFRIIRKKQLAPQVTLLEVEAPLVARKAKAGQFVVLRIDEKGERIPLTIADKNETRGSITLIFQQVGKTTCRLGSLKEGEAIRDLLGPLGRPAEIEKWETVICIGGGVGIAEIFPIVRTFKQAGSRVISILGARNKQLLILEGEIRDYSDELHLTTEDGSVGTRGLVTDVLRENLARFKKSPHKVLVYTVGPLPMMQAVAELTRPLKIKTVACLNPIMVDATGMCGSCRVTVGGVTKFACVDGPDFDAHQVDFKELHNRLKLFSEKEKISIEQFHQCRIDR